MYPKHVETFQCLFSGLQSKHNFSQIHFDCMKDSVTSTSARYLKHNIMLMGELILDALSTVNNTTYFGCDIS